MIYIRPFIRFKSFDKFKISNGFRNVKNRNISCLGLKSGVGTVKLNYKLYSTESIEFKDAAQKDNNFTTNIYENLIKYANEGNIEATQQEFNRILETSSKPHIFMFNSILKSISLNQTNPNKKEIMLSTLSSMENYNIKPDIISFNICFKICSDINDPQYTLDLLKKMNEMNIQPRNDTYLIIVTLLKKLDYDNMLNFWRNYIEIFSPSLSTYYSTTKMLVYSGHINQIKEVYKDMLDNNINLDHRLLLLFLNASYISGLDDFALHLFEKTFEEWKDTVQLDINIFHSLVKIASKFSPSHVYLCIDLMEQKSIPFDQKMYEYVLMSFGKFGEHQRVMNIFNKAKLEGMASLKCYYGILFSCKVNSDADKAWETYLNVQKDGIKPDKLFLKLLIEILDNTNRHDLLEQLNKEVEKMNQEQ